MITAIIHNPKLFEQSSHQYVIIMITYVGKMFKRKNKGLKHKSKSSRFKVQYSKREERREKMIRGIKEIEDVKDYYNDAEIKKTESA